MGKFYKSYVVLLKTSYEMEDKGKQGMLPYWQGEIKRLMMKTSMFDNIVTNLTILLPHVVGNEEKVNELLKQHGCTLNNGIVESLSGEVVGSLEEEIEILKLQIGFMAEDIESFEKKIKELFKQEPPPLTPEEQDKNRRSVLNKTSMELCDEILPILEKLARDLQERLIDTPNYDTCSPEELFCSIWSMVGLDDIDVRHQIKVLFSGKSRNDLISCKGLIIILALSNTMMGFTERDEWMIDKLFDKNSKFGLPCFESLVFRAIRHPFIQLSLRIDDSNKGQLNDELDYMFRCSNVFRSEVSIDHDMFIQYMLCVPTVYNRLRCLSE